MRAIWAKYSETNVAIRDTVDPFMAVRPLTYLGLLYQDLIKQRAPAGLGTKTAKLPPVTTGFWFRARYCPSSINRIFRRTQAEPSVSGTLTQPSNMS